MMSTMNLALIAGVAALLVMLVVMRRKTADAGSSPKHAAPSHARSGAPGRFGALTKRSDGAAPAHAKPTKVKAAKGERSGGKRGFSRSRDTTPKARAERPARERSGRGLKPRRRRRGEDTPAFDDTPLTSPTMVQTTEPVTPAVADQVTAPFTLPAGPVDGEPDWDAMRAELNGTAPEAVAVPAPAPVDTPSPMAAPAQTEPSVWDDQDLITDPGWPLPGDMDAAWEDGQHGSAVAHAPEPVAMAPAAGAPVVQDWLGGDATAVPASTDIADMATPDAPAAVEASEWLDDPNVWTAAPEPVVEPESAMEVVDLDTPVWGDIPMEAPPVVVEPEVAEPVAQEPVAVDDVPLMWAADMDAPDPEVTLAVGDVPEWTPPVEPVAEVMPEAPWTPVVEPEVAEPVAQEATAGEWLGGPDSPEATDWLAIQADEMPLPELTLPEMALPADAPAGEWSLETPWESPERELVGAAESAATTTPVVESPAAPEHAESVPQAEWVAEVAAPAVPAEPVGKAFWGVPDGAMPVAPGVVPAPMAPQPPVTEPTFVAGPTPVAEQIPVADPIPVAQAVPVAEPQPVVSGDAWWDDPAESASDLILGELPAWLLAPTDERLTGRWSLGGMAFQTGHQALSGVTFRGPLEDAPRAWSLPTRGRPAPGTIVLVVEALMNCEAADLEVAMADGFAPNRDGFTLTLSSSASGPFAASGTYRVVR